MTDIPDVAQIFQWGDLKKHIDQHQEVFYSRFPDEYFWDIVTPEEFLYAHWKGHQVDRILQQGSIIMLDRYQPVPCMHEIWIKAYHPDPKIITWFGLIRH